MMNLKHILYIQCQFEIYLQYTVLIIIIYQMHQNIQTRIAEFKQTFATKLQKLNFQQLQPPFLSKSIIKYREDFFEDLKLQFYEEFKNISTRGKTIHLFMKQFDDQFCDALLQKIRTVYIQKMIKENYNIDQINMDTANNQFMLKLQIQELTAAASDWLLQIQFLYDLVNRAYIYFDVANKIQYQNIKLQLKKGQKFNLAGYSLGIFRKSIIFLLQKLSSIMELYTKGICQTLFPSLLIALYTIIGGATLPWSIALPKMQIGTVIGCILGPILINSVTTSITKKETKQIMNKLSKALSQTAKNVNNYNLILHQSLNDCTLCCEQFDYKKKIAIIEKYIKQLEQSHESILQYDEQKFQQIRKNINIQFAKYYQIQNHDSGWTLLLTQQDYEQYKNALVSLQSKIME